MVGRGRREWRFLRAFDSTWGPPVRLLRLRAGTRWLLFGGYGGRRRTPTHAGPVLLRIRHRSTGIGKAWRVEGLGRDPRSLFFTSAFSTSLLLPVSSMVFNASMPRSCLASASASAAAHGPFGHHLAASCHRGAAANGFHVFDHTKRVGAARGGTSVLRRGATLQRRRRQFR